MFTFSESDYKWCPQCAGSIRKDAKYCRFCRKPITNKLMKEVVFNPVMTIDSSSQWLPGFNNLVTKISSALRNRFELADIDFPPGAIGIPDGISPMEYRIQNRETQGCPHEPPEPHELGLIYDMLLSMQENGESLVELCDHPHLRLLELTPQEVTAEGELRKEEFEKNNPCLYCAEYIFPEDEECRFCGGTAEKPPRAHNRFENRQVDKQFLKDILVYESAVRTIAGTTSIAQEILDANGITKDTIEQEILRQRGSSAPLPMPRFYKRMSELNLTSIFSPESLSISSMVDLGSALDTKKVGRADEALIVYEHGIQRTEGKDDLMHERGRILEYLGLLYQRREDYVQYKKYHEMARECQMFGMPDDLKALMAGSDLANIQMLTDDFDDDPEKRLASLNQMVGDTSDLISKFVSHANETLPGLGDAMTAVGNVTDRHIQSSRLMLEAAIARNKGDFDEAERKYAEVLSLCGDSWRGTSDKSATLIALAEVKHLQGDNTTAEATLDEAMKCALDFAEAMPDFGDTFVWRCHLAFACFQRDTGKYVESEESFEKAVKMQQASVDEMMQRYGGEVEQYSSESFGIREQYAKLLRVLNRTEEADKMECEAERLKCEADQWNAKVKLHRATIADQLKGGQTD